MFLGIEIGGTKLQIVAGDASGTLSARWRGVVEKEQGGPGICEQLKLGIAEVLYAVSRHSLLAAGVGFGGPVDPRNGQIRTSHQIAGWENFPLRDWLADLLNVPVAIDNDANVAALGETACGAGVGADPVFYVTMGSGVGGGLVTGGNIYHGLPPGEAEFGHLRLDRDGTTVESRCSGWSVDARIRRLCIEKPNSYLARLIGAHVGGEARYLAPALRENDAAAHIFLSEIADDLAFALSHVVHLVHPQVIVLGGGLSLIGSPLQRAVADALPGFMMHVFLPAPDIRLAGLGEDSVPLGAIELARALSAC